MTGRWRFFPKANAELERIPVSGHSAGDASIRGREAALWTFPHMRWMLFFYGNRALRVFPFVAEYSLPNAYPRKSNSASGTFQMPSFLRSQSASVCP